MSIVVYPGSFNPITNGHTDLVKRALNLFDHVILAIGTSAQKDPEDYLKDRIALCRTVLSEFGDRVSVEGFNSLLVDYVRSRNTTFILRGLRTVTDFDYEFQMAEMNQSLDPEIEYVFLPHLQGVLVHLLHPGARNRHPRRRHHQFRASGRAQGDDCAIAGLKRGLKSVPVPP